MSQYVPAPDNDAPMSLLMGNENTLIIKCRDC